MSTAFSADTIPNRFDYEQAQQRIYALWKDRGLFHSEVDADRQPFTIVIPPPNVTGALHLGHALNNTLQDIIIRLKRMQGYNALWMPGTDHAGIATQAVVERRLLEEEGKSRHDLGREELVRRIWAWKDQYETRIIEQLQQMGCSCDWQRTRFTLDDVCAGAVRHTFYDLFSKKLIYRGKRLVNWDTFLQTAVSDDEVFHDTTQGHFWHIHYPVIDPQPGEPARVTVATTRPETMLGDTALAVHPDPATALDTLEQELGVKLAAAPAKDREPIENQLENVRTQRQEMLPQLEQLRDMALDGRQVLLPLQERPIPLITDRWAKPEMGSGCVKITPAHDPNDYEVGLRCGLPMVNILNPDGTLNENGGRYQGQLMAAARQLIVKDLDKRGLVGEIEDREIDLAHSDRSKTPIEPYLADQWFVAMDELSQSAIDAVEGGRVRILPSRYSKGYLDWLGEKRDWPVSRQLWWGHQIPIWSLRCSDEASQQKLTAVISQDPAVLAGTACYRLETDPTENGAATIHVCIAEENSSAELRMEQLGFQREEDVLDTWFSSALWPHSTLGWPEKTPDLDYYYPTNVLITSRDIITLWVARMVLTGLNNMGEVPFHDVFIHPKILDGYGETMSKSKGNGVDPLDVIEKFGPDALRFALTYLTTELQDVRMPVQFECPHCLVLIDQTKENRDLPRVTCNKCGKDFSTQWARTEEDRALPRGAAVSERFDLARKFCNKLWNASRFSLMNLSGYTDGPIDHDQLTIEDRWILSRLSTVTQQVTEALEGYHYSEAARILYGFAWDDFCDYYIEMAKVRLSGNDGQTTAQRVLAHSLDTLLRLLHPVIPFVTEEIWQLLGQAAPRRGLDTTDEPSTCLMAAPWPSVLPQWQDEQTEQRFERFKDVLRALRRIRSDQNISKRKPINFSVRCNAETVELLQPLAAYFESLECATGTAWGVQVEPSPSCAQVKLADMEIFVDLAGLIDVEAEMARLKKELERVHKQISGKEQKLSNANFVERAPADIVDRERSSLLQLQQQAMSLEAALAALGKNESDAD